MNNKIRVFPPEWQMRFGEAVHLALNAEEGIEVIGKDVEGKDVMDFIEATLPDVVVLHGNYRGGGGIEAAARIKRNMFEVSVVLIVDKGDDEQLFAALKTGANACLTGDAGPDDLLIALRKAAHGINPISEALLRPVVASRVLAEFEASPGTGEPLNELMVRLAPGEAELLQKIADGEKKRPVVGQQLDLIHAKLAANERTRSLAQAVRQDSALPPPSSGGGNNRDWQYVTREEFAAFKKSLREYLRCLITR